MGEKAAAAPLGELPPDKVVVGRSRLLGLRLTVAGLAAALIALLFFSPTDAPPEKRVRRYSFPVEGIGARSGGYLSPDGESVLYVAEVDGESSLWIRSLVTDAARPIPGTSGAVSGFWAPGGSSVGFGTATELKTVSVDGGNVLTVCQLPSPERLAFLGGAWSPDGESIVFSSGLLPYIVPARGGEPELLSEARVEDPYFLPTTGPSLAIAYTIVSTPFVRTVEVFDIETGERREVASGAWPTYSRGHLIYAPADRHQAGLQALPFSLDSLAPTGPAFPITPSGRIGEFIPAGQAPTSSATGSLAYLDRGGDVGLLVRRGRTGGVVETLTPTTRGLGSPAISPDGLHVAAISLAGGGTGDVWIFDLARSTQRRLTFEPVGAMEPAWSPEGRRIVYHRISERGHELAVLGVDGSVEPTVLPVGSRNAQQPDWSADGRFVLYRGSGGGIAYAEATVESGEGSTSFLPGEGFYRAAPALSPSGRLLAYVSNESGRYEVFLRLFPDATEQLQVSVNGGTQPRWRNDGSELYYVEGDTLMAVSVSTDDGVQLGRPEALFSAPDLVIAGLGSTPTYDVFADGQSFVTVMPAEEVGAATTRVRVVENWYEEFRDRER